jgi:hypothetical protein
VDRILAWYRVSSSAGAVIALVVANMIPLVGVVFLGWSVWNVLVIYWLENGIVGVINVLKMSAATGETAANPSPLTFMVNGRPATQLSKPALIPFFVVHYGIFWFVHGIFVLTLPAFLSMASDTRMELSFWWNFLRGGEYRSVTPAALMFAPYRRLIALHLTIIFGAMAVMFTGAPVVAVAILVAIKTLLDLGLHLAEHRGIAATSPVLAD